jgi:hypothetical protein
VVSFLAHTVASCAIQYLGTLLDGEPVSRATTELLHALDAIDARRQVGTQQPGIGGLMRQPTDGCELLVDGIGSQPAIFQVHAIAHHDDAIEGQPRFGAVPGDELIDRKLIDPARTRRSEAVEHGHFGMVEVGESEYDPTIVQFGVSLSHAGGLHSAAWD